MFGTPNVMHGTGKADALRSHTRLAEHGEGFGTLRSRVTMKRTWRVLLSE